MVLFQVGASALLVEVPQEYTDNIIGSIIGRRSRSPQKFAVHIRAKIGENFALRYAYPYDAAVAPAVYNTINMSTDHAGTFPVTQVFLHRNGDFALRIIITLYKEWNRAKVQVHGIPGLSGELNLLVPLAETVAIFIARIRKRVFATVGLNPANGRIILEVDQRRIPETQILCFVNNPEVDLQNSRLILEVPDQLLSDEYFLRFLFSMGQDEFNRLRMTSEQLSLCASASNNATGFRNAGQPANIVSFRTAGRGFVESPMTDTDQTVHGDDDDLADLINKTYAIDLAENEDEPEIKKSTINEEAKESKGAIISTPEVNNRKEEAKTEVYTPPSPSTLGIKSASVDAGGSTITSPVMATVDNEPQFIKITVTEPQKQGEGMSAFIVYKVLTSTNIALFKKREFAAWRRFSDFLGLHSKLEEKHLRKGRIVPPAPEKNVLGNQGDTNAPHSDFVEKRRAGLERFMNRLAAHSVLCIDPDFRDFLESDSDLPRSHSTSAFSSASSVARFLNRV